MKTRIQKTLILIIVYILYFASTSCAEVSLFAKDNLDQLAPALQVTNSGLKVVFKIRYKRRRTNDLGVDQPEIEDIPFYYQTIFKSIFFDESEGLERIKNAVAPESEKFLLKSVDLIDEGALKRVFKVVIETDNGIETLGIRFYFLLRENERGLLDPTNYKEVFQRALAEKEQLSSSYKAGGVGLNIYEYIDKEQLNSSIHSFFTDNNLVGFTVGEYVRGYALDKVDDLGELQSLLKENVITIVQEWFLSLNQERKPREAGRNRGFTIVDLKPANFVYDTGRRSKRAGRIRYIDVDKPKWVRLSNLFGSTYDYIKKTLNDKGVLLSVLRNEGFVFEEAYFRFIMGGLEEGFEAHLNKRWINVIKTKKYKEEFKHINRLRKILSKNLADQSQGEKKIQNLKDDKWEIKLKQYVLKEVAAELIASLEKFEHKLKQKISGGIVVQEHSVTNTAAVMVNSAI